MLASTIRESWGGGGGGGSRGVDLVEMTGVEFIYLKHHCQSILEERRTCSIICPVKAHNHFWELFCRWRTPQWVRWISEDYANVERRNCESCSQSAETNPCAKRHHKTFPVFSLLSNKVLQEITEQNENGVEVKSASNVNVKCLHPVDGHEVSVVFVSLSSCGQVKK